MARKFRGTVADWDTLADDLLEETYYGLAGQINDVTDLLEQTEAISLEFWGEEAALIADTVEYLGLDIEEVSP